MWRVPAHGPSSFVHMETTTCTEGQTIDVQGADAYVYRNTNGEIRAELSGVDGARHTSEPMPTVELAQQWARELDRTMALAELQRAARTEAENGEAVDGYLILSAAVSAYLDGKSGTEIIATSFLS